VTISVKLIVFYCPLSGRTTGVSPTRDSTRMFRFIRQMATLIRRRSVR